MIGDFPVFIVLCVLYLIFNALSCVMLNSMLDGEACYQEETVYFYTGVSIVGLLMLTIGS